MTLSGAKSGAGIISTVTGMTEDAQISDITGGKPAIGKTGVHLRDYKKYEYAKLSKEQRHELREWTENLNSIQFPNSKVRTRRSPTPRSNWLPL
jgi:hypothetical protein